jgi:hypothetical protein
MKLHVAQGLLLLVPITCANIIFHRVQPVCNSELPDPQGCLRGQICLTNNTYVDFIFDACATKLIMVDQMHF